MSVASEALDICGLPHPPITIVVKVWAKKWWPPPPTNFIPNILTGFETAKRRRRKESNFAHTQVPFLDEVCSR